MNDKYVWIEAAIILEKSRVPDSYQPLVSEPNKDNYSKTFHLILWNIKVACTYVVHLGLTIFEDVKLNWHLCQCQW